jgi:hypothetical protein
MLLDIVKTFADRTGHGPGQSVDVKMSMNLVDRPPRESFEDWEARRQAELAPPAPQQAPQTSPQTSPQKQLEGNVLPWPRKGDSDA